MLQLKFNSSVRELNLPLYSLSEHKSQEKSCFVDSNRIDTVRPFTTANDKTQSCEMPSDKK